MAADKDAHLHNAAKVLQRILGARDPDHVYTVKVLPPERRAAGKTRERSA